MFPDSYYYVTIYANGGLKAVLVARQTMTQFVQEYLLSYEELPRIASIINISVEEYDDLVVEFDDIDIYSEE